MSPMKIATVMTVEPLTTLVRSEVARGVFAHHSSAASDNSDAEAASTASDWTFAYWASLPSFSEGFY